MSSRRLFTCLRWAVALAAGFTLVTLSRAGHAQDLPKTDDLVKLLAFIRPTGIVVSIFVVVGVNILLRLIASTAARLSEQFANRRPIIQKTESITRFLLYVATAFATVALSFEINEQTLHLIGVFMAFGFGFALKDVGASIIAGITIIFDRPFQVGDRVQYAGQYGDIIQIGLRSVRMRTLDDNIVTIPNNRILTDVSASGNYGALDMQVVIDFYIGADQDLDLAEQLVREAMLTSRYIHLDKPIAVLVKQQIVADMVVIRLRGKSYVLDTKYEKAFETDVYKRALAAFRRYGILPPAAFERASRPRPADGSGLREGRLRPASADDEPAAP